VYGIRSQVDSLLSPRHSGPGPEDGPATEITLWRGDNKESTCDLIPYTFRNEGGAQSEGGVVKFDAAFLQQPDATFLVKIEWDPTDPTVNPFNPPDREIDLLLGDGFQTVEACLSLVSEGTLVDLDPDIDDVYEHPEGEPWCLAGERLVLGTDGLWTQIQWYDGGEDPNWR